VTPLFGRNEDLDVVCDLIKGSSTRLVTLTGPGGIGKSRLAIAVAQRMSGDIRDGVAFVPLASVLDETLVLPEIGRALRVDAERIGSDDAILDTLLPLELLLLLDNLEHLPGAAAVVSKLLSSCPGLKILATSRASLRVRGEVEYDVPPLSLPDLHAGDLVALSASPAASLLVERGRAVRREFAVRPRDVPALAAICHRLAGLPLALELAAVGLRVLDPVSLLTRLDDVLAMPGTVDLPARQRSMRATLDWSYGLLAEQDRALFRVASVFVGGFTLEAAEAVAGFGSTLEALQRLTQQSLCTTGTSSSGALRHGMLEPVAQYARSLLAEDEELAARSAHAEFFLAQAEKAGQDLQGGQQVQALDWFDTEEGNLWSALKWSVSSCRGDVAGRLTWALYIFWWVRGRRERGRRMVRQVLDLELTDLLRAQALHVAAALPEPGTEPVNEIEDTYLESAEVAERCGDLGTAAASANGAGLMALARGDLVTAEQRMRHGLSAAQHAGVHGEWSGSLIHIHLATARRLQGDYEGAVQHAEQALGLTGRRADLLSHSIALYNLAQAELGLGQRVTAREHLVEAAGLCQQTRDAANLSYILDALAAAELDAGKGERVATLLGAAEGLREAYGSTVYTWYAADLQVREQRAGQVRQLLGEAAYERAVAAGHVLAMDGAVELARRSIPTTS
jgi:predicted ATPase